MKRRRAVSAFLIFAAFLVVVASSYFAAQPLLRSDSVREGPESHVLQPSGDGDPILSVVETDTHPDKLVEPEGTQSSSLPSFVTPDQVREGISVLRGESIPTYVLVTEVGIGLAMSDRTEAVLVTSVGMSEQGAYEVRKSALEHLASDNLRSEHFLDDICDNADFYASSAMELAEKVLEYDIETDRLKEARLQQLSADLSASDFDKLLKYSMGRAQSMTVTRADMRVFATQGLLDARGYVTDICGSKV
jgi:hypothetical protein